MSEIARAAEEQANGLSQVNTAVNHMDQLTQQNAAMVEQSAAAAEQLRQQVRQLNAVVHQFSLVGDAEATITESPVRALALAA